MKFLALLFLLLVSTAAVAQYGAKRVGGVLYHHGTVGTSAADALTSGDLASSRIVGWKLCHDGEATATYLAASSGTDPATDGMRLAPGDCFECVNCAKKSLADLNVKAQASTGYSIVQYLP